jgi:hypothetical protein
MNSSVHGSREPAWFCMQLVPNLSALRTPSYGRAGCGGRQRKPPTGGAANGIPRKAVTPLALTPASEPVSVLTTSRRARSGCVAKTMPSEHRRAAVQRGVCMGLLCFITAGDLLRPLFAVTLHP